MRVVNAKAGRLGKKRDSKERGGFDKKETLGGDQVLIREKDQEKEVG